MARSGLDPESVSNEMIVDDDARGVIVGTLAVRPGLFDGGLASAVDTLARTAFYAGLAAAQLDPPIRDPEAFYGGLIRGIQETDRVMRRQQAHAFPDTDGELDPEDMRGRSPECAEAHRESRSGADCSVSPF